MCLSIQQPWADLILDRKKRVENRRWPRPWMPRRTWNLEGSVPLAVHASKSVTVWKKHQDLAPDWRPGESVVGAVLGIVDVVEICRYQKLPPHLKGHRFADNDPSNWCWVLDNPRRFRQSYPTKGNVFIKWPIPERALND
jgi:hypothetical protein